MTKNYLKILASPFFWASLIAYGQKTRNCFYLSRGEQHLRDGKLATSYMRVERTFAWEDKFKRLLLRFERIQQRHYGMKLMAYTLINLRAFCGA